MEGVPLPNAQDEVREAIIEELPPDAQTRRDWAGVFSLTAVLGYLTILFGIVYGIYRGFVRGMPWWGVAATVMIVLWGAAAVSVSREGREVSLAAAEGGEDED